MLNTIVISPNSCKESAKILADLLEVNHKTLNESINLRGLKIINYGCSLLESNSIILNKARSIRRCINKLRTHELLKDHILLPALTKDKEVAKRWCHEGGGVVIRNRIKGSRSEGVIITGSAAVVEEEPAKFYTQFIHHENEIRINCYKDSILSVYNKIVVSNDFKFVFMRDAEKHIPDVIKDMVKNIHQYLEIDIYGIDVLVTEDGHYYLLEVNSAPILFPITASRLAKLIKKDFQNDN